VNDRTLFQPEPGIISWRIHFASSPERVYRALSTDEMRRRYWAENVMEADGTIRYVFLNGIESTGRVLEARPPQRYAVTYFENRVTFDIASDGCGGSDMLMRCMDVQDAERCELTAGWVSWLLAMKAAVDFDVDLRNHDPDRTWQHGYADN
jgi:uncharacterized protein YndB with AHSA1/START domain